MTRFLAFVAVAAAFLLPHTALAEKDGHAHAAPNGGQIRPIGKLEIELVVKGSDLSLYIVDEKEQKVDASKFSATAVVLAQGNAQKSVELKPAGENKLQGKMDFGFDGKFRATVTLRSATGELGKARFSLDPSR